MSYYQRCLMGSNFLDKTSEVSPSHLTFSQGIGNDSFPQLGINSKTSSPLVARCNSTTLTVHGSKISGGVNFCTVSNIAACWSYLKHVRFVYYAYIEFFL